MGRKSKTHQNEELPNPEAAHVQRERAELRQSLEAELKIIEDADISDKKLASLFMASSATLPARMRIERLVGNRGSLVIEPDCTLRQKAAIIEIAHRLSEKAGRHPTLDLLRPAFLASMETYAVLEMASDLYIADVADLSRIYGDFEQKKDQIGEKILRGLLARPPQAPATAPSADL